MVLEEIDITRWSKQYLWESILQARKEWYLWNIRLYKYRNKKMLQKKTVHLRDQFYKCCIKTKLINKKIGHVSTL